MKFTFPTDKNTIALIFTSVVTIGFFIAGLFEVLHYFIIKALLCIIFVALLVIAFRYAIKNDKKNRLEDKLQDDSH